MPIYEYRCADCQARFEELVRTMTPTDRNVCPQCGGRDARRLISVFNTTQTVTAAPRSQAPGGCGRCGDPAGPCGLAD